MFLAGGVLWGWFFGVLAAEVRTRQQQPPNTNLDPALGTAVHSAEQHSVFDQAAPYPRSRSALGSFATTRRGRRAEPLHIHPYAYTMCWELHLRRRLVPGLLMDFLIFYGIMVPSFGYGHLVAYGKVPKYRTATPKP